MTALTDKEILDIAIKYCEFTPESTYHLAKYSGGFAILRVVRECLEFNALCDQALAGAGMAPTDQQVCEAMQATWNDFVADTHCYPDDISANRGGRLTFTAGRWAVAVAEHLRALIPEVAGGAVQNAAPEVEGTSDKGLPDAGRLGRADAAISLDRPPPVAAPLALLREARRDWLGGHRANADELEFCARIDAALAASGPERRKGERRSNRFLSAVVADWIDDRTSDRRQSAPRPDTQPGEVVVPTDEMKTAGAQVLSAVLHKLAVTRTFEEMAELTWKAMLAAAPSGRAG